MFLKQLVTRSKNWTWLYPARPGEIEPKALPAPMDETPWYLRILTHSVVAYAYAPALVLTVDSWLSDFIASILFC